MLAIAAAILLWIFLPRKTGPQEFEITRLTFDSGMSWNPAFSPDGKMMAYASDRGEDGNLDIWVQQLAGGTPLRLTTDPADDNAPSFSPDGSRIVLQSDRDGGGIYEVGTLGGAERRVAGRGFYPRYSPDGAWISYVEIPASLDSRLIKMLLMPAQGGTPAPFQPEFNIVGLSAASAPVRSPDGKYLIFNGRRTGDPASLDWWVAPAA
jgi:Tol biopolymer transport system component